MTPEEFEVFRGLVETNEGHRELECAKYLHFAADLLFSTTPLSLLFGTEDRNFFGSTDFVASAKIINDRNVEEHLCTIWELKSPQSYLFEYDDNQNRCRPTPEFLKAENQLIHYANLAMGDQSFRQRFEVLDQRNIRPGGIIIGRSSDRMLRSIRLDAHRRNAFEALSIRENFFYRASGIRILTWDKVLDFVRPG